MSDMTREIEYGGSARPIIDVSLRNVSKRFGDVVAVDSIDLDIYDGEFFSLLGPSGCGKTTTLSLLAGFEVPDKGRIFLRGDDVTAIPAFKRDVNTVFQNYELFPHMTVFDNLAYGLRMKKVPKAEAAERVAEMLEIVQLTDQGQRKPRELSGGQQQRVALARALVNRPAALLLDEPLSALDVKLRKQMQFELKQLQMVVGTTFIYVTHDQEEAMVMSDRLAVMNAGRILQVGRPLEIYEAPSSEFVAEFIGSLNVISFPAIGGADGNLAALPAGGRIALDRDRTGAGVMAVAVRPERMRLRAPDDVPDDGSYLPAAVSLVDFRGQTWHFVLETALGTVSAVAVNDDSTQRWKPGDRLLACWPEDAAVTLPSAG